MNPKDRVQIAVPKDTDEKVSALAEKLDDTKGRIVKRAVDEFAKRVDK